MLIDFDVVHTRYSLLFKIFTLHKINQISSMCITLNALTWNPLLAKCSHFIGSADSSKNILVSKRTKKNGCSKTAIFGWRLSVIWKRINGSKQISEPKKRKKNREKRLNVTTTENASNWLQPEYKRNIEHHKWIHTVAKKCRTNTRPEKGCIFLCVGIGIGNHQNRNNFNEERAPQ